MYIKNPTFIIRSYNFGTMLFNSFEFFVFLPTVFFFYWFVFNNNLRLQNLLLLISGYVFYGWWDWEIFILNIFIYNS